MIKDRTFLKDLSGVALVFLMAQFVGFINNVLVARYFGPKGKGEVALLLLTVTYMVSIFSFGVEFAFLSIVGKKRDELETCTLASLGLALLLGILGSLASIVFAVFFMARFFSLAVCISVIVWCGVVYSLISSSLYISGRVLEEAVLNKIRRAFFLSIVLVMMLLHKSLIFLFTGYAFVSILQVVVGIFLLKRYRIISRFTPIVDIGFWRELVIFGLKVQPGTIFKLSANKLDFFIVSYLMGNYSLGIYSVAVGLSNIVLVVPHVLGVLIQQRAAILDESEGRNLMIRVHKITSFILILIILSLMIFGKWCIVGLYGVEYMASFVPFLILLPGIWAWGMWKNLTNELVSQGYPTHVSLSTVLVVVLTLLLDPILIPQGGLNAASFVSTLSYFVALLYIAFLYSRSKNVTFRSIFIPGRDEIMLYYDNIVGFLKKRRLD